MSLTCPKCHGEMRQYERSGVVIDQCGECRGIFLDRGELEKLFEAEANWSRQQGAAPRCSPPSSRAATPASRATSRAVTRPAPAAARSRPHQPGYGAVPPPPPPAHGYPPAPRLRPPAAAPRLPRALQAQEAQGLPGRDVRLSHPVDRAGASTGPVTRGPTHSAPPPFAVPSGGGRATLHSMTSVRQHTALAQAYDGITRVVADLDDAACNGPPGVGAGSSPTCCSTCSATPSGRWSRWPAPPTARPTSTT